MRLEPLDRFISAVERARGRGNLVSRLGLHQRPVTLDLVESESGEPRHDSDPVNIIRDDGSVGGRVVPTEDCVQKAPAAAAVQLRAAALKRESVSQLLST